VRRPGDHLRPEGPLPTGRRKSSAIAFASGAVPELTSASATEEASETVAPDDRYATEAVAAIGPPIRLLGRDQERCRQAAHRSKRKSSSTSCRTCRLLALAHDSRFDSMRRLLNAAPTQANPSTRRLAASPVTSSPGRATGDRPQRLLLVHSDRAAPRPPAPIGPIPTSVRWHAMIWHERESDRRQWLGRRHRVRGKGIARPEQPREPKQS
jgi:hypothetical protein